MNTEPLTYETSAPRTGLERLLPWLGVVLAVAAVAFASQWFFETFSRGFSEGWNTLRSQMFHSELVYWIWGVAYLIGALNSLLLLGVAVGFICRRSGGFGLLLLYCVIQFVVILVSGVCGAIQRVQFDTNYRIATSLPVQITRSASYVMWALGFPATLMIIALALRPRAGSGR